MSTAVEALGLGIKFKLRKRNLKHSLKALASGSKQDNEFWALRNINFSIKKGDILGVIGGNGAGKSTLLRTIGGIYHPDEGTVVVNGTISALLSLGTGFKQELTGYDNIFINGAIMGFKKKEIEKKIEQIIEFSELGEFIYQPVKTYSSGMGARLGFSIAAFLEREIMLIDEILGVGDFRFKKKSQQKMEEMINDGRTVIIVSHNLESINQYANKALWLNKGKQMMFGEPAEIIEKYLES